MMRTMRHTHSSCSSSSSSYSSVLSSHSPFIAPLSLSSSSSLLFSPSSPSLFSSLSRSFSSFTSSSYYYSSSLSSSSLFSFSSSSSSSSVPISPVSSCCFVPHRGFALSTSVRRAKDKGIERREKKERREQHKQLQHPELVEARRIRREEKEKDMSLHPSLSKRIMMWLSIVGPQSRPSIFEKFMVDDQLIEKSGANTINEKGSPLFGVLNKRHLTGILKRMIKRRVLSMIPQSSHKNSDYYLYRLITKEEQKSQIDDFQRKYEEYRLRKRAKGTIIHRREMKNMRANRAHSNKIGEMRRTKTGGFNILTRADTR